MKPHTLKSRGITFKKDNPDQGLEKRLLMAVHGTGKGSAPCGSAPARQTLAL